MGISLHAGVHDQGMTPTLDEALIAIDQALRTVTSTHRAQRPPPSAHSHDTELLDDAKRLSGALMRVNHVGEVCAQALYQAQALSTPDPSLRRHFKVAAREETDHLAWTTQRLSQLQSRPSRLNPVWYAGAFAIGLVAGRMGDRASLGFVIETERQVEEHLLGHLDRLPAEDTPSRAIVEQMRVDEARHAMDAERAGGVPPPAPIRWLMRAAAKVMTTTAHYV